MAKILIKNGRVFDGYKFFDADVLTNDDKIERIEPHIECDDPTAYVFDAAGKIVSAGLVDIHVHLQVASTDKFGISADLSTIPFGVTAAVDAGRTRGERAILDSFTVKNVLLVTAHIRDNTAQLGKVEEAEAVLDEMLAVAENFLVNSDLRTYYGVGSPSPMPFEYDIVKNNTTDGAILKAFALLGYGKHSEAEETMDIARNYNPYDFRIFAFDSIKGSL